MFCYRRSESGKKGIINSGSTDFLVFMPPSCVPLEIHQRGGNIYMSYGTDLVRYTVNIEHSWGRKTFERDWPGTGWNTVKQASQSIP